MEEYARYFEVRKEVLSGITKQFNVLIDGTNAGTCESDGEAREITTGFSVWEYNEQGMTDKVEFYPVKTDTTNWENDEDEVLKQIISDHPAGEWQNNEW